ncbi:MAG: DUF6209 family protein [Deltaproteobacteria bacterium]|nr:DUF6209 family protein [Deltaproteobacteria bacterium]
MNRSRFLLLVGLLPLTACGDLAGTGLQSRSQGHAVAALSPSIVDDGGDRADRACQVVLRSAGRLPGEGDYQMDCDSGECLYYWEVKVDVDEDLPEGTAVRLLYRLGSEGDHWQIDGVHEGEGRAGYRRYHFGMSDHLFGPQSPSPEAIEVLPFVELPGGTRLFDHNRYTGPFDTHRLTASTGYGASDGGVCQPPVGSLFFDAGWGESRHGTLRQGGFLRVQYQLDRLPHCRGTHNGHPAWDVVAHARFLPEGQHLQGSVRQLISNAGIPTNEATERTWQLEIPENAESIELWFENYTGAGSSCVAWDSNYGENYHFEVWPDASDPRCLGLQKESGAHTESDQMVHNQPHCVGYELAGQYDATACELHVVGFGDGYMGHYGIPTNWLVAYLEVGEQEGEVLEAGLFTRSHGPGMAPTDHFSLGLPVAPGVWKVGFTYQSTTTMYGTGADWTVDALAFFVDVRRPDGEVVRLWQSRGGANYTPGEIFAAGRHTESIPYGRMQWATEGSVVFESRRACQ